MIQSVLVEHDVVRDHYDDATEYLLERIADILTRKGYTMVAVYNSGINHAGVSPTGAKKGDAKDQRKGQRKDSSCLRSGRVAQSGGISSTPFTPKR